jgi:cyclophilin family peptidyl-prolyl cis-trans isomerase/HEAT repeat protein
MPQRPATVILDESAITAIAELLRMEDRRLLDSVRIAGLLNHPEPHVRGRAALAGGRIGDRRATPLLIAALADSATFVRARAAFALGQLGDTSIAVIQALGSLAATAADDSVAVEAIGALGQLGAERGRGALIELLAPAVGADSDTVAGADVATGDRLREALLAIWRLPRTEAAVRAVRTHVSHPDGSTRWRAVYALMRFGDPSTVDVLLTSLDDADPLARSLAARALRATVADSAGTRGVVLPALVEALADEHPHVRINAAGALATYTDSSTSPALTRLLGDADVNVAVSAAQALGQTGGVIAADTLAALAADSASHIGLRATALAALVRADTARGVALATDWAASIDWLVRLHAARALRAAPWAAAEPALRTLAADDDPLVTAAAIGSIAATADSAASVRPLYVEALGSADETVRAAAASALARRVTPADLDILLQAYDVAQADASNDAALAALDGLAALARQDVPVARPFFLRFTRSADPIVRRRVAEHFGTEGWGQPLPAETDRSLDFYLGIVRDLVAAELAGVQRPRAVILTAAGGITLELFGADAPVTVHNLMALAARGYFRGDDVDGSPRHRWHRVVPNFVLQDGDPRGDGSGGPGHAIRDEINLHRYGRGALGMALAGPDTGGSQFFITHSPQPHLDGGYTVFGRVIAGMEVADRVVQDDPILSIEVYR